MVHIGQLVSKSTLCPGCANSVKHLLFTTNLQLLLRFLLCFFCSEFAISSVWFQASSASLEAYVHVLHLLFDLLFGCLQAICFV